MAIAGSLASWVQPAAAISTSAWVQAHVRNEHVVPAPARATAPRLRSRPSLEPSLSALRTMAATRAASSAGRAAMAATANDTSIQFLTRPYTTWHNITSVFDHCNPDYTTDGKVCEFDGSVGLKSYGVDPTFSLGYAQTPGGSDYLSYDGHNGWDYALNYENILASADGVVQLAGSDSVNPCFGQTIIIDHRNGFSTRYAHLSQIYVAAGQNVSRGQVIAQSGNTGCSSGPHLHFGVYITSSWTAIDPWGWWGAPGADPWPSDPGNLWLTGYAQFPIPYAATNVTATAGPASARISWSPPSFTGGTQITSYTVTSTPCCMTAIVPGSQTSTVVIGLSNNVSYTFTVTATNGVGVSQSSPSNAITPTGWTGQYRPLTPARILDTRYGTGAAAAPLGAGAHLDLPVVGQGGVPASNVAAVILNVTATNATANSYLTVYPTGATPSTSALNFNAGETTANLVQVPVGDGGEVSVLNGYGSVDVIYDVVGYYTGDTTSGAGEFRSLTPSRLLDTRTGTGGFSTPIGPKQSIDLQVTGRGGVPSTGVSGVVLNLTVTTPTAESYLTVYPAGTSTPLASNLNFRAGQTVANRVVMSPGSGGKVTILNGYGSAQVIVDVSGWYTDSTATADGGGQYHGLTPARVADSRNGTGGISGAIAPAQTVSLALAGVAGVPAMNAATAPTAVVANLTVTNCTGLGYLIVYPSSAAAPLASDLNYAWHSTRANDAVAKLGADGKVIVYNGGSVTDLVVDVMGWFN